METLIEGQLEDEWMEESMEPLIQGQCLHLAQKVERKLEVGQTSRRIDGGVDRRIVGRWTNERVD